MDSTDILHKQPASCNTPVSEDVLLMAQQAVKDFHECFWWWHQDATINTKDDVRQVVDCLRLSGGHRAWQRAQTIHKLCR